MQLELFYMLYPDLAQVRKWIGFKNTGAGDLKIESLNVEDPEPDFSHIHTEVYHNYARMKHLGAFVGTWDDPVVVLHQQSDHLGMAVGNEVSGILGI